MSLRKCALCHADAPAPVIDLGFHPCADTFVFASKLQNGEQRFPLQVCL